MQPADDYAAIYAYLRRTYYVAASGTWNAVALKQLSTTAYTAGTKEIAITATNSEAGGGASGEMKFNKIVLLQAIEALLQAECSATLPPEDPAGVIVNFGNRPAQF